MQERAKKSSNPDIDEEMLLNALRIEEQDSATFYASEISREQAVAADRYFARPYGDGSEVPNRSQVCTHDIQDSVAWAMPPLMRTFTQADDLISVEDDGLDDGDHALDDAANYLHHVLFKDNPGNDVIHDWLFDGLVQKYAVIRTSWEPAEPKPPEVWEGLTYDQLLKLSQDKRYKIIAAAIDGEIEPDQDSEPDNDADDQPQQQQLPPPQQPGPGLMAQPQPAGGLMPQGQPAPQPMQPQGPEPTFTVQVQKIETGRGRVEVIPPEEFRISRRARSIEEAPYHGWRFEDYAANIRRLHPDRADDIDADSGRAETDVGIDAFYDERLTARFPDELDNGVARIAKEPERRRLVVHIEYIKGDFDNDGVVELRRIKRCGDVILENDIARESEFTMWSPIRVSHRAIGLSMADTLLDIQKIRTVITRRAMDALTQALMPRTAVSKEAMADDPTLLDRLLDHEVGDVIPVRGDPAKAIMPLVSPDVSSAAFTAIEYWDRRSEEASGVNRHAMGIQPDAITDTAKGIDNLQSAANSRIEQYARWAASGLEKALNKLLRLLIAHQDQPRIVKINGRRMEIDPRRWSDDMTVNVHVGMAAENRERRMQFLGVIASKQEAIMTQAGLDNPLCGPKEYENTLSMMAQTMGFKKSTLFFKNVPDNWQPPPPQPDPKVAAEQAKIQMQQQKNQADVQLAQQKQASDVQMQQAKIAADSKAAEDKANADAAIREREAERAHQINQSKIAADAQLAREKAQAEAMLARQKLATETQLAREKLAAEMELARFKTAQEVKLQRHKIASQPRVAMTSGSQKTFGSGDGIAAVRQGGRVG